MAAPEAKNSKIVVSCTELEQPIGSFFIGAIEARDLVAISYADVRRPQGRDLERYIGTQRDLSPGRVAEIKKYVTTVDACFPTSIILAIDSKHITQLGSRLEITRDANVAKIIDGQHRIAGLENYKDDPFYLNVTIFVDMELEDQAMVFATINLKQTRVTKSLAYDLYEYATKRSPQKTCHNIAKLLNFRDKSPLRKRIKILGKVTGEGAELISQSTVVDRLLRLISTDPMIDKDRIKRNLPIDKADNKTQRRLIFRNQFIDEKDAEIAKSLWNFFDAVAARWPNAWTNFSQGQVLPRTTGFAALIRILPVIWEKSNLYETVPKTNVFADYLGKVQLQETELTSDVFKPGSEGEGLLVEKLTVH